MLVMIRGIHKVRMRLASGQVKTYYYAWRGGPMMKSAPHTEAFALEHARYKGQKEGLERKSDTLETLIEFFIGTNKQPNPHFISLARSTQDDHLYSFKLIRKEWPGLPVRLTQQKGMKAEIRKWHSKFAANPRKADKLLMSLSKVFSYALEYELVDKNPCKGIKQLYEGSRRDIIWSQEQIAAFRAGAATHLLLPFEIAIYTGQRQGDILALSPKEYDGIYLRFKQSKGSKASKKEDKKLSVLVHKDLRTRLDQLPTDGMRLCRNSRERPWTNDGFQASWRKELERLGIEEVTFHDLRGTFITERYREGSSIEDIAKISGHSTQDIRAVLEKHYLSPDQARSDSVIRRMEKNAKRTKTVK